MILVGCQLNHTSWQPRMQQLAAYIRWCCISTWMAMLGGATIAARTLIKAFDVWLLRQRRCLRRRFNSLSLQCSPRPHMLLRGRLRGFQRGGSQLRRGCCTGCIMQRCCRTVLGGWCWVRLGAGLLLRLRVAGCDATSCRRVPLGSGLRLCLPCHLHGALLWQQLARLLLLAGVSLLLLLPQPGQAAGRGSGVSGRRQLGRLIFR